MDEEDETFDHEAGEYLEDEDFESERAQHKTYEDKSDSDSVSDSDGDSELNPDNLLLNIESNISAEEYAALTSVVAKQATVIGRLEAEIDKLTTKFENGEINMEKYNENLIRNQMLISDEKYKLMKFVKSDKVSKDLMKELNTLFIDLEKKKTKGKFDPSTVGTTIDDIFRKYGELLEKELTEENEFFFESNPITSNISNIVNMPTPEKYQKQLQTFEQKFAKNDVSVEDIYAYLDLRFYILDDILHTNLRHDILYVKFNMDLRMEFASLRTEIQKFTGETSVVIDEEINEFNEEHDINTGDLKTRADMPTVITTIRDLMESKITELVKKYESAQDTLFKKQDSTEVLKIIKQLREIYIKNKYLQLERRFTDEEIIGDLKNMPLEFIIEKYAQYINSDYFEWASGKKKEEQEEDQQKHIKKRKKRKLSEKEVSFIREAERREYRQRKEFEKILTGLPKEVLLNCADILISKGLVKEPYAQLTRSEKFINDLYERAVPLLTFSINYSDKIVNYAKTVNKITDEFMINKHILKAGWNQDSRIDVGDVVYIDRSNDQIKKIMDEMINIQNKIDNFNKEIEKTIGKIKVAMYLDKLRHKLTQLEMKLNSYDKYMRSGQVKGIAVGIDSQNKTIDVKIDGTSKVRTFPETYVTRYLKPGKDIPLYIVADSNTFNPTAPLKETGTYAITQWIRAILGDTFHVEDNEDKEKLGELYDEALDKYNSLSEIEKHKIDSKVMKTLPSRYKQEFTNGIPNKGPLIYIYPPALPEVPDNEEPNYDEFIQYSKNLRDYVNNLTPEKNPYVKVGVPVTNKLIDKIREKVYPNLEAAIKHTPVNGFFKLSSIGGLKDLVFNFMTDKEKKVVQRLLLTNEQLVSFMETYYIDKTEKAEKNVNDYRPISNSKVTLLNELKSIVDPDEYIKQVIKIDKGINITKVVGEEVFIEGRTLPITKTSLEKTLSSSLERDYQKNPVISITKKQDPVLESIEWALSFNPTFQLLDLSKKIRDSFIVHSEPKYRIRIVNTHSNFNSGWIINPIKEIQNKHINYEYKYPLIITDFTEYLKIYRANLLIRYESFKQLDILSYEDFTSSNYIMKQIKYIGEYLKNMKIEDVFDIGMIKQEDAHLKIRQEQRKALLESLTYMYGELVDKDTLHNIANDIELEVYMIFEDIRSGQIKESGISGIDLSTDNPAHYELLKKFRKSGISSQYVSSAFYHSNKGQYSEYIYRMSIAIFNIYRTNNFIQDYIEGKIRLDNIIYRDLTQDEMTEGPDTIENLINWLPPTEVLDIMRKADPNVYERTIKNSSDIVDISVINTYELEVKKKMSFLNKKLALIELVRLKSWQRTLAKLNEVPEKDRLRFLITHRNSVRQINNITAKNRLETFNNFHSLIYKCKFQMSIEMMEEYAENIEAACYSLSSTANEYNQLTSNIASSQEKLCKMISTLISTGTGPVDIVANIAELYLDFGKTHSVVLKKVKIGDWNGIKSLPTELLTGIKKVANSMSNAIERKRKGDAMIRKDPELGIQEFKIEKNSEGDFIVKQIDKPIIVDEKKRNMNMFLKILKFNYVSRVNDTVSEEIQKLIDKNDLTENIIEELNSREDLSSKDIERLKSLSYEQLLDISSNFYRQPTFVDVIPLTMAKEGVRVYPVKNRGGFLIGGSFPRDAKAYRYRDSEGIKTHLIDICKWVGVNVNKTKEIVLITGLNKLDSIYVNKLVHFEQEMMRCIDELNKRSILVKISGEDIVNSKEVLSKVITEFDMQKSIAEAVFKYFNEYGGNKALFPNGGTKEEYDSFLSNTMYIEAMQKLLGVSTLKKKKEVVKNQVLADYGVDVSILNNNGQIIYRKLYKSKTQTYPVPIGYDANNYPIYSKRQKIQLAYLIEHGYISPWYKNKIQIFKKNNDIEFEGNLPFVIDESSNEWNESYYYVEQTFKDPMYGLPIVTRIGIIPKRIKGAEGYNIIKKIKLPENKYIVKEEPFKIKYFKSEVPSQSQVNEFRLSEAQNPLPLNAKDISKKSGYSIIDSRMLSYSVKYTPDDVWTWDPLKDYKVGAQQDNDIWITEKNRQMSILKEWLRKTGSSSSAFIAAKNESTRHLQWFRLNLPSQKRNEITQIVFKRPAKTGIDVKISNVLKMWKKYNKDKLINESKRIGFYTSDMNKLKPSDIVAKMKIRLEQESKINASAILQKIGVIEEPIPDEYLKTFRKEEERANYERYINLFIKNELLVISPDVMKVIENPKLLFPHYNRSEVTFDESGNVRFIEKYGPTGPHCNKCEVAFDKKGNASLIEKHEPSDQYNDTTIETIYEIIKNMSYTTNFGFNKNIIDYINNISLFDKLSGEDKLKLIAQFPILKVIFKIKQNGQKINIWNILTTVQDMWYPMFHIGMSEQQIKDIKRRTLKYTFEEPIEIKMEDVINYLGDSYYQNMRYTKGINYEMINKKYTGGVLYLQPRYRFEKIESNEVSFTDKTSSWIKYSHNPYVTLFRNVDDRDPKTSIEMLVIGEELHNNKFTVSTNLARRAALLYGVDLSIVDPCFSLPDPNISGKFRDIAINKDDILKFMAKGGNYYTILEMPDEELKFRKLPIGEQVTAIKHYRAAVKEYFKSKDKKKTYTDFIQKKHLNPLTLMNYIKKVEEANPPVNQLMNFIDNLNILPDFLDANWPSRKKIIEKNFTRQTRVSLDAFLGGEKRDIYINIAKPTKLLKNTEYDIPLDLIWKSLGYGSIEECKTMLLKNFKENVDYKIEKIGSAEGSPQERITVTLNCFRNLYMKSRTKS